MSDDLLDTLTLALAPARQGVVGRRLATALAVGGAASLAGVAATLGLRADMVQALGSPMFWIKLAYTGAFAALGAWAMERLSRPGGAAGRRLPWLLLPLAVIAGLATLQLAGAPAPMRAPLVMGGSAAVCPWFIAATAAPLFAALVWALRGLGPTRLRLTGAVAGLTAGGAGAAIYALHCPESTAPFVALWYTLGVLLPAAVGAALGPRLLRW